MRSLLLAAGITAFLVRWALDSVATPEPATTELSASGQPPEIPIVQLNASDQDAAWARAAQLGVARLRGHGVDIAAMLRAADSFFSLPLEQKMGVRQAEETPGFQRGYIPLGGESGLADNVELKEGFCYGYAWPPSSPPVNGLTGGNEWPDDGLLGSAWRETMLRYYNTSLEVADLVMAEATRALALPPELAGLCDGGEPISTMRLFHYFAISDFPALAPGRPRLGSSAHTDWHVLTLILQDTSGGLQVLDPDGRWLDVPPVSDELVLLFGDYLQVLSEGTCRSPVHRVLLPPPGKERFSFTFFQYPAYERKVPAELVARSRDAAARRKESTPQRFNTLVASGDDAGHEALSRVPIGDLLLSKWRGVAANSVDEVASKLGAAAGA